MIAAILDRYGEACQKADIVSRPQAWAAHYDRYDSLLGTLAVADVRDDRHLSHVTHGIMAPFGTADSVTTSWSVTDAKAGLHARRSLFVSRLTIVEQGVNMNHWQVYYSIDDQGQVVCEAPLPATVVITPVLAALSTVTSQRLAGQATYYFEEAFRASEVFLEMLARGELRDPDRGDSRGL